MPRRSNPNRAVSSLLLAAAVSAVLAGCGGGGGDAVEHATVVLNGLGVSGSTPLPSDNDRRKKLQAVIASLKPVADEGGPRGGSANLLLSRAHAGLAELAAIDATALDGRVLDAVATIRGTFDLALSQRSVAAALSAYDPTRELAELDEQIRQREHEAAEALAAKQKQQAAVDRLNAESAQARQLSDAERTREAEIRLRLQGASETTKASIIEEANVVKRRGDEYEKHAAGFAAEAARELPEVANLQSQVDKLTRQAEYLRQAKQGLRARADANRAQADIAAGEARATEQNVTQKLQELAALRDAAATAGDETVRLYQAAIGAAGKATTAGGADLRSSASLAKANLQQSLGDLLVSRSSALKAHAVLMGALVAGKQPGVAAADAAALNDQFTQVRAQAVESYKSAMDLFAGSGGKGDQNLKARLDALAERMRKLAEGEAAPAAAPDAGEAPVEKPGDAGASPAPADFDRAAVEAEVRPVLAKLISDFKARDFGAVLDACSLKDDKQREVAGVAFKLFGDAQRVEQACQDKFGKGLQALVAESQVPSVKGNPMLGNLDKMMSGMSKIGSIESLDAATVRITPTAPDAADVFDGGEGDDKPMTFRKIDGVWKAEAGALGDSPQEAAMMTAMLPMLKGVGDAFGKLSDGLGADKYADADAMLLDLSKELMAAMAKMAPGGAGGGGGGAGGGGGGG